MYLASNWMRFTFALGMTKWFSESDSAKIIRAESI